MKKEPWLISLSSTIAFASLLLVSIPWPIWAGDTSAKDAEISAASENRNFYEYDPKTYDPNAASDPNTYTGMKPKPVINGSVAAMWPSDVAGNRMDSFRRGEENYGWRVKVVNRKGDPVVGASVLCRIYQPGAYPGAAWATENSKTDVAGVAAFEQITDESDPLGTYTVDVSDIRKPGFNYEAGGNLEKIAHFEVVGTEGYEIDEESDEEED